MKIIGITGGIASGKTTVARMFAAHGFVHLDADQLVHQLMRRDQKTIDAIAAIFPSSLENGEISRRVLSQVVTQDSAALSMLEAIIHPRVREIEMQQIEEARANGEKGVILDIPLLFETGADEICDFVVAVHAPLEAARQRAFARSGMTEEKWQRLTRRQMSEVERCARADAVIPTDGSEGETRRMVDALIAKWNIDA